MMRRRLRRMMVVMMVLMLRWVLPLIHICGTHSASCSGSRTLVP